MIVSRVRLTHHSANFWHKECIKIGNGNANRQYHRRHPGCGAGDPDEVEQAQGAASDFGAADDRLSAGHAPGGRG